MSALPQLRRLGLFDSNVPRYTSYPPANHFSGGVTGPVHRDWLASIPDDALLSVYLHVPFCRRLCWFCACRTQGTRTNAPVQAYVDTLIHEISLLREILPAGVRAQRIHWGGGTPTLLQPADIDRLASALADAIPASDNAEISVEVDPNEIDEPRLAALAAMGMNRASIGVQDFDPDIQKIIGREQSFEVTKSAVDGLRARGVHSLNTDLLYGLPLQTPERITSSIQMLSSLSPDRIALYGYAHVPWMAKRQSLIPTEDLPGPEARLHLFETAQKILGSDGYEQIGIDHFARPTDGLLAAAKSGHLRRNFQGYTDDTCDVLLGIGASAISKLPQGYVQNATGTAAYQKAVRGGQLATGRSHIFSGEDKLRARLIEMIMCDFHVDVPRVLQDVAASRTEVDNLLDTVAELFEGLVIRHADALVVPPAARPLARLIARRLDAYESHSAGHSSAI